MKILLTAFLFLTCISCHQKKNEAQASSAPIPKAQKGVLGQMEIVHANGKVKLTLDEKENIKRIENLPGYFKMSDAQKDALKKVILSKVPKEKSVIKKISAFSIIPCDTSLATAAECAPIIAFYHLECPPGYLFNKTTCQCANESGAPAGSMPCFTYFQAATAIQVSLNCLPTLRDRMCL